MLIWWIQTMDSPQIILTSVNLLGFSLEIDKTEDQRAYGLVSPK